jgi:hypothetical protein
MPSGSIKWNEAAFPRFQFVALIGLESETSNTEHSALNVQRLSETARRQGGRATGSSWTWSRRRLLGLNTLYRKTVI